MSRGLIIAIIGTVVGAFFIVSGIYTKKYKKSLIGVILTAVGTLLGVVSIQKKKIDQQKEKLEIQDAQISNAKKQMQEVTNVQTKLKEIQQTEPKPEKKAVPDSTDSTAINDRLNRL